MAKVSAGSISSSPFTLRGWRETISAPTNAKAMGISPQLASTAHTMPLLSLAAGRDSQIL